MDSKPIKSAPKLRKKENYNEKKKAENYNDDSLNCVNLN